MYGSMKDRIKKFMNVKSLTAAELADKIGVQRSNVSHVLNGRNNPSSVFIEKLLQTFPELDARWLILGEGEMLMRQEPQQEMKFENNITEMPQKSMTDLLTKSENKIETDSPKNIDRIVILYDDKTFRDYFPE